MFLATHAWRGSLNIGAMKWCQTLEEAFEHIKDEYGQRIYQLQPDNSFKLVSSAKKTPLHNLIEAYEKSKKVTI